MLVLSRKETEEIVIGDDIRVIVRKVKGNRVTIAIDAPRGFKILRGELTYQPNQEEDHERVERKSNCPD